MNRTFFLLMKSIKHLFNCQLLIVNCQLIFLLLIIASCRKENLGDCFKSTGSTVTEYRTVPDFDSIRLEDNINLFLKIDTFREVRIEAGSNLIPLIKTDIENNFLVIRNRNTCNWVRSFSRSINVYVTVPHINVISSNASGKIQSIGKIKTNVIDIRLILSGDIELDLDVGYCYVRISAASGDLILHGFTPVNEIFCSGTSWIKANDLATGYTFINSQTTGNIYVNATKVLGARLSCYGDVYYSGNPDSVISEIYSTGKLIKD